MRIVKAAVILLLSAASALAGSGTVQITPGSGASIVTTTDGAGNNLSHVVTCDAAAGANCTTVKAGNTAAVAGDTSAVLQLSPNGNHATAAGQTNQATAANQGTSNFVTNPTSTITLPAATTAYTAGFMMANTATGTSVSVPSFAIANVAGGAIIQSLRIGINDAIATGWGGQTIQIDLWSVAPTFAAGNGDRGAFKVATGSQSHIRTFTCLLSAVQSDGVFGECSPTVANAPVIKLASGTSVFWTAVAFTGSGVTGASKIVTLTAELLN